MTRKKTEKTPQPDREKSSAMTKTATPSDAAILEELFARNHRYPKIKDGALASQEDMMKFMETTRTATLSTAVKLAHTATAGRHWVSGDEDTKLMIAAAQITDLDPQTPLEAMLIAQMIAVHNAAARCTDNSCAEGQTFGGVQLFANNAIRFQKLFLEQIEALQKLRGQAGQQKMTVEHVHVHEGGQAIVGSVEHNGGKNGK